MVIEMTTSDPKATDRRNGGGLYHNDYPAYLLLVTLLLTLGW